MWGLVAALLGGGVLGSVIYLRGWAHGKAAGDRAHEACHKNLAAIMRATADAADITTWESEL